MFFRLFLSCSIFLLTLLSVAFIVGDYFTGDGVNEVVVFHALVGSSGAGISEYYSLILTVGVVLVLGLAAMCWSIFVVSRAAGEGGFASRTNNGTKLIRTFSTALVFILLGLHPALWDLIELQRDLSVSEGLGYPFQLGSMRSAGWESPEAMPNLVVVFAESLERAYLDTKLFPGLMEDFAKLQPQFEATEVEQLWSMGWTSTGLVSALCGFPLVVHAGLIERPAVRSSCFSDLLKDLGYDVVFYQGTSSSFYGPIPLFQNSSFDQILSLEELRPRLPASAELSPWGLFDSDLFGLVHSDIAARVEEQSPFAVFLTTLDTHHPRGHVSPKCKGSAQGREFSNSLEMAIWCTQRELVEFVTGLLKSANGRPLVVAVVSDHLAQRNLMTEQLRRGERRNLFRVFSNLPKTGSLSVERRATLFDVAPTLFHFMGGKPGQSLGLGRDLLSSGTETFPETYPDPSLQIKRLRFVLSLQ